MANELIINASLPETRIALLEDNEIQDLLIERATDKGIVGNVYKGRVTRVLPGMQAAFVDIGLEKAAFLYVDDVVVHSDVWEDQEDVDTAEADGAGFSSDLEDAGSEEGSSEEQNRAIVQAEEVVERGSLASSESDDEDEGDGNPVAMSMDPHGFGRGGRDSGSGDDHGSSDASSSSESPEGTVAPESHSIIRADSGDSSGEASGDSDETDENGKRRHRRGRRGGRGRRQRGDRPAREGAPGAVKAESTPRVSIERPARVLHDSASLPKPMGLGRPSSPIMPRGVAVGISPGVSPKEDSVIYDVPEDEESYFDSDRGALTGEAHGDVRIRESGDTAEGAMIQKVASHVDPSQTRPEFREPRNRDRRVRAKSSMKPPRGQVNIQDLLKEGQEVIVQVAKDPIATKGARLTCHISLAGRHLVCMPTIDHVGVSRRIERDDERRRLREFVEQHRPKRLGFIVRTASGKSNEKRLKQDIDYLARLWEEIREKASQVSAPALVYEDLNSILRSIRDWVTEEIDKIIVDSRYHYNEILRFVQNFMPNLRSKVELYHGDIPIFDAYGISPELARALERKVWLKSGGYIVVDQAEALVAIDVNTGRFVGKKNLEDTILKTNLEAVEEVAYQLRLRNCGGIIIIDLIDMEKEENRQRVYRALEEALKKDRARPTIMKISDIGLVEMTRKRTRDTIVRSLCESCAHCEGKGFVKSKHTVAYEVLREIERLGIERDVSKVLVQAHSEVIDILATEHRETLDQIERRYRKQIYLQTVADYHPEQFEVICEKGEQRVSSPRSSGSRNEREPSLRRGGREPGRESGRESGRDHHREQASGGSSTVVIKPVAVGAARIERVSRPPQESRTLEMAEGNVSVDNENPGTLDAGRPARALDDPDYSEEDRLAFQRAQAAQDAALAKLNPGSAPAAHGNGNPREAQGNGPGGRPPQGRDRFKGRGRRGRGGGRGGRDRPRGPAGAPAPAGGPVASGSGAPVMMASSSSNSSSAPSGNGNGDGTSGSGGVQD